MEEKILMRSFASINAAQAYDHVCQKDSLLKLKRSDPIFANLYGNMQMLAFRIGGFMHERRPKDTAEQAVERLQSIQKLIAGKTELALKKDGCEGDAGKSAKSSYDLYTKVGPVTVHQMIDEEIVKNGGTPVLQKVRLMDEKDQKAVERLERANSDQLESLEAAESEAMPVDTPARAYPAWGEWVKNQFKRGGP